MALKTSPLFTRWLRTPAVDLLLLVLLLAGVFIQCLAVQTRLAGMPGFAMDDSWIHVTVARNFVAGDGWGVVPGKTLAVSTSPTWTLLLSFFFLFFSNPVKIGLTASFLSMTAAVILFYLLAGRLIANRFFALVAAALFVTSPISIWGLASGLEIPLALAGLMLTLYVFYSADAASRLRQFGFPLAAAFAAVTRPELFILIPIGLFETFRQLYFVNDAVSKKLAWRVLLLQCLVLLVALSPYFAFNLYSHGKIFPATYYAKTIVRGVGLMAALQAHDWSMAYKALFNEGLRQVFLVYDEIHRQNFLVFLMLSAGLLGFARPFQNKAAAAGLLLPLALLLVPYAMGISAPSKYMSNHASRYFAIFPPLAILMACMGLQVLYRNAGMKTLAVLLALAMFYFPYKGIPAVLKHVGIDAESTQRLYVEMPLWIRDNLDPNARLAVNDIGGLGFFTRRDMIDVMGLATPEIWPAIFRAPGKDLNYDTFRQFLRERQVDYVILSPRYYPRLTDDRKTFEPLKEWKEKFEHGRTISPQIVYKVHWDK